LVGRRLCGIASAVYGAGSYLETAPSDDLGAHAWIAPDDSLAHLAAARWLRDTFPRVQPVLRVNTLLGMTAAARAGIAWRPCPASSAMRRPSCGGSAHPLRRWTARFGC
jgi:hypothetical protein